MLELISLLLSGAGQDMSPFPDDVAHGEPALARVWVSGEHVRDGVVYHYRVDNLHPAVAVARINIGSVFEEGSEFPALQTQPVGTSYVDEETPTELSESQVLDPASFTAPPYWHVSLLAQQDTSYDYLELSHDSMSPQIDWLEPGEQISDFSIKVPVVDRTYVESGFTASFYHPGGRYWGVIEKLDTQPPELEISVDESMLWPPNGKLRQVHVNLVVSDDYDSRPEIRLISITANEELTDGDIVGASIGSDDREFELKAARQGGGDGRVYTIAYEALDSIGNTVIKTVEVRVPHDQRDRE